MRIRKEYKALSIVTTLVVTMLFSCKNNFKDVQKVGVLQNEPIGEAENIDLKYTEYKDSVVFLKANLLSEKLLDYSNRDFQFSEFPEGIELKLYDEAGKKTTIFSDYAVVFDETNIIDLQGNVIIATHEKDTLFTEQLYYDQKSEWVFTNYAFTFKRTSGITEGYGFDADRALEKFQMLEMAGDFEVDN